MHGLTQALCTGEHLTAMPAETVGAWWHQRAAAHQGLPSRVILDQARAQRGALGHAVAPA